MVSPVRALIAAFLLTIVVISGAAVLDDLTQATGGGDGDRIVHQAALFEDDGEHIQLNDGYGRDEEVLKTTGYAVNLTGASDSYIESQSSFGLATDEANAPLSGGNTWTISVWGHVDAGNANSDMAAVSANGNAIISYVGDEGIWRGWYYDEGGPDTYVVNVSTSGDEVGNYTNAMLWHNGSHLTIYRDGTQGEIIETNGSSVANVSLDSTNWDGRLEEIRTFDRALDASNRSTLVNSPVEQLPDADPTSRAMFDQPGADTQLLLYTDTSLQTSNVTYDSGFSRQVMQSDDNLIGGDYRWEEVGPTIAPIEGSELGGAPVAYANYTFNYQGVKGPVDGWLSFSKLVQVIPIVLGIVALLTILGRVRE